jgi:acetyl-CoA synthetase
MSLIRCVFCKTPASTIPLPVQSPGGMAPRLFIAGIVERVEAGIVREITEPMVTGELALRPGWPSMMRAYLNEEERYRKCFMGGWYLTGDLAMRDDEGYYWFVGRADDWVQAVAWLRRAPQRDIDQTAWLGM